MSSYVFQIKMYMYELEVKKNNTEIWILELRMPSQQLFSSLIKLHCTFLLGGYLGTKTV